MKKDWIAREMTIEVIVGTFVIMILLGLAYFTIMLSKEAWLGDKHIMEVVFEEVMGLREGDNVVVRGMTVGKVKSLLLKEDGVHVVAVLNAGIMPVMKEDYRITIVATSVLGGRYMLIDEGSDAAQPVWDLPLYAGQRPYDLIADAAELVNSVRRGVVEGGIVDNFKEASDSMREIASRLRHGKGSLGRLLSEDDSLYDDLSSTVASLKQLSERIEKGEGAIGKLLSPDEKLYKDLSETVESVRRIAQSIDKGEGSIGMLVRDESLYKEVQAAVEDVRAAIDDMRETTPVATFASIFFGVF